LNNIKLCYENEPLLAKYYYGFFKNAIDKKPQFVIVPLDESKVDCIIDIHIIKNDDNTLTIHSNIIDPHKNNVIINSEKYKCKVSDIISKKYLSYKKHYREPVNEDNKKNAHLLVKAINMGESFKEEDEYLLYEKHFSWGSESYLLEKEGRYSSVYPAEQKCIINGNTFDMNHSNKVFYNGKIAPGSVKLFTSFKTCYWDPKERRQNCDKTIGKRFIVKIKDNVDIKIDIICICKYSQKDIKVAVYRKKAIKKGEKIEEKYEIIQVFSD